MMQKLKVPLSADLAVVLLPIADKTDVLVNSHFTLKRSKRKLAMF